MSWTAFGMSCLSAALAARTGQFDRRSLGWLKAEATERSGEALAAVEAFERGLETDADAAGVALQDYVGRLAVRLSPPVRPAFDWQGRADLR